MIIRWFYPPMMLENVHIKLKIINGTVKLTTGITYVEHGGNFWKNHSSTTQKKSKQWNVFASKVFRHFCVCMFPKFWKSENAIFSTVLFVIRKIKIFWLVLQYWLKMISSHWSSNTVHLNNSITWKYINKCH